MASGWGGPLCWVIRAKPTSTVDGSSLVGIGPDDSAIDATDPAQVQQAIRQFPPPEAPRPFGCRDSHSLVHRPVLQGDLDDIYRPGQLSRYYSRLLCPPTAGSTSPARTSLEAGPDSWTARHRERHRHRSRTQPAPPRSLTNGTTSRCLQPAARPTQPGSPCWPPQSTPGGICEFTRSRQYAKRRLAGRGQAPWSTTSPNSLWLRAGAAVLDLRASQLRRWTASRGHRVG